MTYVPGIPPPQSDSPRVRELSKKLADVIDDFQGQYPMRPGEIRQALRIAASQKASGGAGTAVAVASGVGLLIAIGLFAYYISQREPGAGDIAAIPAVLIGVGIVVVGVAAYLRNR
jgi:hypothetical protein